MKILRFFTNRLSTPGFEDPRTAHIARQLQVILWMVYGLTALLALAAVFSHSFIVPSLLVIACFLALNIAAYACLRRGLVNTGCLIVTSSLWAFFTLLTVFFGGFKSPGFSGYIIVILVGRLLLERWVRIAFTALMIFTTLVLLWAEIVGVLQPLSLPSTAVSMWILQLAFLTGALLLLHVANQRFQTSLRLDRNVTSLDDVKIPAQIAGDYLESRASDLERRVVQLQVASAVARDAAMLIEQDEMMHRVVDLVCDRFGFYYAAIYLVDERREFAVLRAATGGAAQELIQRGHKLKIGEAGIIGYVTGTGQSRIAGNVESDTDFLRNPLLPETRSEMTLPLKIGNQVIGALDVQSKKPSSFAKDDLTVLQTMADQLAIAIENAHLFDATGRQLNELTILHGVATAGAEASSENRLLEKVTELIGETLFPDNFGVLLVNVVDRCLRIHPSYRGLDEELMLKSCPFGEGVVGKVADSGEDWLIEDFRLLPDIHPINPQMKSVLCVPIRLGERVLGVINAESAHPGTFTEGDRRLLATIAGQLATAIEKVRLFESERLRAEELAVILKQREELMRLKSEFIQNVSHELRTPLAIARGYVSLLHEGEAGELNSEQQEMITIVNRRMEMLTKLVGDLTVIVEAEAGQQQIEPVKLSEIVQAMLQDYQVTARKAGVSLQADLAPDVPEIMATPLHIQRVVDNLVNNALKFTPAGGLVTVRLTCEGPQVVLCVEDSGVGIPADKINRILERFYQVDGSSRRRYGGTGLGLALVKEIVELYAGTVEVQSTVEKGSKFTVRLPALQTMNPQDLI